MVQSWTGTRRRALRAVSTTVLVGSLLLAAAPAEAAHGVDTPGGPYDGFATSNVLHVDAVTHGSQRLLDAELGVTTAAVDSEGLEEVLNEYERAITEARREDHATASASIVEVGALLSPPKAANQLRPHRVEAFAPEDASDEHAVLNTSVGNAAHVNLIEYAARARWNSTTCVIGEPIAASEQQLLRLELLETAADDATPEKQGFDAAMVGLDASEGGPSRAVTTTRSKEQLFKGDGEGFGLLSATTATLAPVTFFEGQAQEFTLEFSGPATLSAMADGTSGGAKVAYEAPLVTLIQNKVKRQVLPGSPVRIRMPTTGDAIAEIKLGTLDGLPTPKGLGEEVTNAAGTFAAGQANVVEVKLLDALSQDFRAATVAVGHLEARAKVPAGGIQCPLPVQKDADPRAVSVGEDFTTTITVTNPYACPITDIDIVDEVTTENAARFEVLDTTPNAAAVPSGSGLADGVVRWEGLGPLDPGESLSVEVTFEAQGGVGRILDTATASGTLENCRAEPGSADAAVFDLTRADVSVEGSSSARVAVAEVLGEQLARTGAGTGIAMTGGAVLLLGVAALAGARRRRT